LTDQLGVPVERYTYDAYGCPVIADGTGAAIPANSSGTPHTLVGNPWLFTGRQFDEETGLYFYRARYYDCSKGRFLQRDPVGYLDGINLYEYVAGHPTIATDPIGLQREQTSSIPRVPFVKLDPLPNRKGCATENPHCGPDISEHLLQLRNEMIA